jgi:hypothetical protein
MATMKKSKLIRPSPLLARNHTRTVALLSKASVSEGSHSIEKASCGNLPALRCALRAAALAGVVPFMSAHSGTNGRQRCTLAMSGWANRFLLRSPERPPRGPYVVRAIVVMSSIVVGPIRINVCAALMQGTETSCKAPLRVGARTNIAVAATEIALVMNRTCRCCRRHKRCTTKDGHGDQRLFQNTVHSLQPPFAALSGQRQAP